MAPTIEAEIQLDKLRQERDRALAENTAERIAIWAEYNLAADVLSSHPTEVGA